MLKFLVFTDLFMFLSRVSEIGVKEFTRKSITKPVKLFESPLVSQQYNIPGEYLHS